MKEQDRLMAEIERLNAVSEICGDCHKKYAEKIQTAKSEAIKEFAERLTDKICDSIEQSMNNLDGDNYFITDVYKDIVNLVKEMTEQQNGKA